MRYTRLLFVLFAFTATLIAADPFAGTWKLNSAKTKYKTGTPPKEQTVTFSEEGSTLHVMVKGTSSDGKTMSSHFTVPIAGGSGKIIESPYEAVSGKNISPNERETTFSKGGKVVYTATAKRSADGKTLTVTVKGTNVVGQSVDGAAVYDKQ
jgi:surface antigen